MKRRLIALLLIAAMLCTLIMPVEASEPEADSPAKVTIQDALEILKYLAKMDSLYNGTDVTPQMIDALEVLKYLAKMVDRPILPLEREPVVIGCDDCGVCEDCDPPVPSCECGCCDECGECGVCEVCDPLIPCEHINLSSFQKICEEAMICLDCEAVILESVGHNWRYNSEKPSVPYCSFCGVVGNCIHCNKENCICINFEVIELNSWEARRDGQPIFLPEQISVARSI